MKVCTVAVLIFSMPVYASQVFLANDSNNLYQFTITHTVGEDTATTHCNQIVELSKRMSDIALDANGTLYGISYAGNEVDEQSHLYTIDMETGETTWIGGCYGTFNALSFDAEGSLYAGGYTENSNTIIAKLDANSGQITQSWFIEYQEDDQNHNIWTNGDIAFDDSGTLYFTGSKHAISPNLFTLDTDTEAVALIGSTERNYLRAMDFGDNGVLYGFYDTHIVYIETNTGSTYHGNYPGFLTSDRDVNGDDYSYIYGMTYLPEPTTMALLALGGLALIRRHRVR